jgi:hypothetical protein
MRRKHGPTLYDMLLTHTAVYDHAWINLGVLLPWSSCRNHVGVLRQLAEHGWPVV